MTGDKELTSVTTRVRIDDIVVGQRELMENFIARHSHLQPMLKKAMVKAYGDALDHMALLLDTARVAE